MKIKDAAKRILYMLAPQKCIQFESCPDLGDNTKAVFDEMVKRGLNKKYILIWVLNDGNNTKYPAIKNVRYVCSSDKKLLWFERTTKCHISCNKFLIGTEKSIQTDFYLTHGTALKKLVDTYKCPEEIDYMLVASENVKELMSKEFKFPIERIYGMGYPRNDALTASTKLNMKKIFGSYQKYIVWYPTFRQNKSGKTFGNPQSSLPIIHDVDLAHRLNQCAKENATLIIAVMAEMQKELWTLFAKKLAYKKIRMGFIL